MSSNQKSLIIGDDLIGDLFLARPLIYKLIRDKKTPIDIVLNSYNIDAVNLLPEINEVHLFDSVSKKLELKRRMEFGKKLKKYNYQNAYILLRNFKSALIPFYACIPNRYGYKNEFRSFLLTDARKLQNHHHCSEKYAYLAYKKGEFIDLTVPEISIHRQEINNIFAKFNLNTENKYIVICPGVFGNKTKAWSTNNYRKLAQLLIRDNYHIVIMGSKSDKVYAERILENSEIENLINLTGETSVTEAATIIKGCFATIANDSALMHISAALSVFTLGIFTTTEINEFRPHGKNAYCTFQNNSTSSVIDVYKTFSYIVDNNMIE